MSFWDFFLDGAAELMDDLEEEVVWLPKDAQPAPCMAAVQDHGDTFPPTGFKGELFQGRARYATFWVRADVVTPRYGDSMRYAQDEFEVREAIPKAGLWILRCAAAQSGRK